jgi:glycosyltransferase involved in cell wall biosynthesis
MTDDSSAARPIKVCFVLNDLELAGGVGVVLQHARQLSSAHDMDVTLALTRPRETRWQYDDLEKLKISPLAEARDSTFDVAIATWWETAHHVFELNAQRYAYFVQNFEDRFYQPRDVERLIAAVTHDLPFVFITEARWIAETLKELRPDSPCFYVRNGISKDVFVSPDEVSPNTDGPLRVLLEGHPDVWFKAVGDAVDAVSEMKESRVATFVRPDKNSTSDLPVRTIGPLTHQQLASVYADVDVVLKLSRVEGMFGPPLEGFHMGATCVVTPVTGHEEYVIHGWNGVVCDWDDIHGTARWLDLLARNRVHLHYLRSNALLTARRWPSWEQSGQFMAAALKSIVRLPPAPAEAAASYLMADIRASAERFRRDQLHHRYLEEELRTARHDQAELVIAKQEIARRAEQHRELVDSRAYRIGLKLRILWQHPVARFFTAPLRFVTSFRRRHGVKGSS